MRTVLGSLLVVALSVVPAAARQAAKAEKEKKEASPPAASGARLELNPEVHDFGKVKQHLKLEKEFEIRNTGSEDLTIGRISTSCGCTAALTSDKVVKPGKTTTLKVTLETREYNGAIERSVSIASNDPKRIKTVKVKAFVEGATPQP